MLCDDVIIGGCHEAHTECETDLHDGALTSLELVKLAQWTLPGEL